MDSDRVERRRVRLQDYLRRVLTELNGVTDFDRHYGSKELNSFLCVDINLKLQNSFEETGNKSFALDHSLMSEVHVDETRNLGAAGRKIRGKYNKRGDRVDPAKLVK